MGLDAPRITAAVRTGDTTQRERAAMLRTPPHILVTTPESLYLLLTAERSREMLRTARMVIVDEIHAVIGTRRGSHLAISLERLQKVAASPLHRVGLSATQKPIEEVAKYLAPGAECTIIDEGHRRAMDLDIEMPRSPLETVMAHEVWEEYYERRFPVSKDGLVECAALRRSVRKGELDRIVTYDAPLDVLAQQIVAESSCDDSSEDEMFDLVRRAWPYRDLKRNDFDTVLKMI